MAAADEEDGSRAGPEAPAPVGDPSAGGWARVKAVFLAAVDQPDSERVAFLDAACAGDPALRREVEELLASDRVAGSFCERPAASLIGDPEPLPPGTRLGHYTIETLIGAGGMGEVYRARDSRLGRAVALKVLPEMVRGDPDRRRRFEREARAISSLTHPHICTLYDIGAHGDLVYLVMELVEGDTLARRLERGALPLGDALRCGAEIAGALERAHERGIVHRDLKPANVILMKDGAKLLDFSLAKVGPGGMPDAEGALPAAASESAPGRGRDATRAGAILGTTDYLSPEQARGEPVDERTDIWAFGCVLYEMLAGRRAFPARASPVHSGLAKPEWDALPAATPAGVRHLLVQCLQPEPSRRLADIREARLTLEAWATDAGAGSLAAPGRAGRIRRAAVLAALAVAILASAGWWLWSRPAAPSRVSSVAVLPLQGPAGNPTDDEFAEVMTDELTSSIARIAGLHVKSRSLAMEYRDSPLSFGQIATQLGVDAVIHGSVARSGNRIRIRAGMVEAGTDRQLWFDTYDQPLADVLTLQADFARAIAEGLQVTLTDTDRARLAPRRTVDAEAYALYVRAMSRIAGHNSQGNFPAVAAAVELFEEAIALDPGFADAQGGLALALAFRSFSSTTQDRATLEPRVRASIDRALALDPLNSHAHLADARLHWSRERGWPHAEAIRRVRLAIQLNPASETATRSLGIIYGHIGFPEEALEEIHKADVVHPMALIQIGMALQMQGKPVEALASYEAIPRAVRSPLVLLLLTSTLVALDRVAEAEAMLDEYARTRAVEDHSGHFAAARAFVHAVQGRTAQAEAEIGKATARTEPGEFHHTSYLIGAAYARMGQPQKALDWLEHTAADGFPCYPLFATDRNLDPLRRDPRFTSLLDRLRVQREGFAPVVATASAKEPH
jgi:TolB-like protein